MVFQDRDHAAALLARELTRFTDQNPIVLGVPRGGVPMARIIADALGADLDVVLVRKLRAAEQPEFAIGAVDEQGKVTENVSLADMDPLYVKQEIAQQLALLHRRRALYTPGRVSLPLQGRCVIVVDDGVATGSTLVAALRAISRQRPKRLVVATAVASPRAIERLEPEADEIVCLQAPPEFYAVGQFFHHFESVSDREVIRALAAGSSSK